MKTAAQGHQRPLRELIKTAKALYSKMEQSAEKTEQLAVTLGLTLAEAKARKPDNITWPDFVKKHFDFGQSRADELIRIGHGKTTVEKVREGRRESVKKVRAKSALRSADRTTDDEPPPPREGGSVTLFGDTPMSPTAAKKLERQNEYAQVGTFFHELHNYIHGDYCPRLTAWVEAHPELDDEGKGGLVRVLESCSMELQLLAQKIDGR